MAEAALVILARAPELGRVKTRLAAGLGADGALAVYRQLLAIAATTLAGWPGPLRLLACGAESAWAGTGLEHLPRRPQPEGGLGTRIAAAFAWGFAEADRVVVIGTDCPGLRPDHLVDLARKLQHFPVAFGPAEDGGYWGVACRDPALVPLIADDALPWSSAHILASSRLRLDAAGVAHGAGAVLADCDDVADLAAASAAGFLTSPACREGSP